MDFCPWNEILHWYIRLQPVRIIVTQKVVGEGKETEMRSQIILGIKSTVTTVEILLSWRYDMNNVLQLDHLVVPTYIYVTAQQKLPLL